MFARVFACIVKGKDMLDFEKVWNSWHDAEAFSGVVSVRDEQGVIFEKCQGFRIFSEQLPNNANTAFGIASGTKLFTALAVCKLIDGGKLSLNDKLWDLLPYDLGQINRNVTVYHLLTHTSGIGDYLDEETPDAYEQELQLTEKYPVYLWKRLEYYLQMITPLSQKFEPGARFGYSNAGYVMLGLVVEAVTGKSYQQYVAEEIIQKLNLRHTGFYRMDALPANTAFGYVKTKSGAWRSNIFMLPVIGGSDGGLFTCAQDVDTLWRSIFDGRILSETMLRAFLKPQVIRDAQKSFGLGAYRFDHGTGTVYYAIGGDFGVDFSTAYFPEEMLTVSAFGNAEVDTLPLLRMLMESR